MVRCVTIAFPGILGSNGCPAATPVSTSPDTSHLDPNVGVTVTILPCIVIFLILALGFVITAYTGAASRRIRPRIVLTRERPEGDLGAAVMPFLLLALLVAIAVVMDRGL